jgi:hypothetical protein
MEFIYSVTLADGTQRRFDTEQAAKAYAIESKGMMTRHLFGNQSQIETISLALSGKLPKWEPNSVKR